MSATLPLWTFFFAYTLAAQPILRDNTRQNLKHTIHKKEYFVTYLGAFPFDFQLFLQSLFSPFAEECA